MFGVHRRNGSAWWCSFILLVSGVMLLNAGACAEQELDTAAYHRAVEYCRGDVVRPTMLSPDGNILCMDGIIMALQTDSRYAEALAEGGIFVVRSAAGVGMDALALSKLLLKRRATVVIYDYCLSACANYLFFASVRTYVLKGALVAWHVGDSVFTDCPTQLMRLPDENGPMTRAPCDALPGGLQDGYRKFVLARDQFYSDRSKDAQFRFPPTTPNIARFLSNWTAETAVQPNVA